MKYSVHTTKAKAETENQRLMGLLGIPDGKGTLRYGIPEQRDGKWLFRIKESGTWKADDVAENVEFLEEPEPAEPE
jgi:hypothetical protein